MATLSMRLMRDFPKQARIFKTKYFRYKKRSYRNHNGLLFSYKGTEGIKTGFTRASGFNLAASVKRNNKHLIAVVMGGKTSRSRNREMERLLTLNLPKAVAMNGGSSIFTSTASNAKDAKSKTSGQASWSGFSRLRPGKSFTVQLGAFEQRNGAVNRINQVLQVAGDQLGDYRPYILDYKRDGVHYHRARLAGFASKGSASRTCTTLEKQYNINCTVMSH
jgi:D-alanyl-D-alanine carboxypeptidase